MDTEALRRIGVMPRGFMWGAVKAGIKVVSWDSPIHSAEGEDLLVAQVDFADAGKVLAQMAHDILGPAGGKFARKKLTMRFSYMRLSSSSMPA